MGVIAYIRQIYLDADHYKLVKDAYDEESARHEAAGIRSRARRRDRIEAHSAAGESLGGDGPHAALRRGTEAAGDSLRHARRLSTSVGGSSEEGATRRCWSA